MRFSEINFCQFIEKGRYGSKVTRYFKKLYEKDRNVPSFSVGGAKKKRNEWDIIDYRTIGGNCLEFDSRKITRHQNLQNKLYLEK